MPVSCSALDCKNRFKKGSGITFHRFPISRPDLMAKWLKAVARENWMPSPRATLCSDHFTKDCFEERNDRRHLKFSSIPTIFPPPKNKNTSSRRLHKAKASGEHYKRTSEVQVSHLPSQADSVDEAFHQPTEPAKITELQSTLTTETLNTGRLAQLAAAAVLNLAEFSQVLEVPLKPEAESSEVLTLFNCSAQTQTCTTDAKMESVSSGFITVHSEEQSQDSAAALCSDAFHWTANVPEVLSDTSTALVSSVDVPTVSASILPCLFTTSTDITSEQVTISEETTWISTEVLIPETEAHLSTRDLASEEVQCSSETVLSSPDDQDLSGMTFPQDHSYFMSPCPDIIRRTLEKKLAWERKKNEEHRQKFRVLQQKLKRKEQKIDSLTRIINQLREKHDEHEKEELDQTQQCHCTGGVSAEHVAVGADSR
ncbi:THAP domain-containing protein 5-like isoform X1 [Carcharodon carcharias]|uniref:THAP domain-containing protein 5-like isoform X1 n=2 Tax=Carcharodon carcharias TaxID=13397 RepID=UPI001B7E08E1|nr:THAP domain-containing protein 5-like isoform X1 [Carcharodon carcharias]XP_041029508.1 THAP domain-containing protein 5-like isoform X1 [Carcharodon carcharias]XP_041029517.1 THAP domain-containing protein 5-like isoform X1 [Carcharodon carcharias]